MASNAPYISFVTYGRNDAYTPSYVRRVSRATLCLARQLERAGVDSEIVITDWNPPAGRPLLLDSLEAPKSLRHVSIRGIVVGPEHHTRFTASTERGIHTAEAGNVGIRRARGRFVTPKASDTYFSPKVIEMIARRDLDDDALLAKLAELPASPHALIQQMPFWELRDLHTNACGDFTLMSAAHWHLLRGHPRDTTVLSLDIDSLVMHAAAAQGVNECRWPDSCRVFKPSHGNISSVRVRQIWRPWQRRLDKFLSEKVSEAAAHRARTWLNYPRRTVRGIDSLVGPSIERNFVRPASQWARGARPVPTQPENWGLADATLEQRVLCQATWDA
jgi:hypothetical protein